MWRTTLSVSLSQQILSVCFYFLLTLLVIMQLYQTEFDSLSFLIVLLLMRDCWRSQRYFFSITGEFVLFHYINQIYWHQQRWHLLSKPLQLRYAIMLNLKSRKNGARVTLFLFNDSFSSKDWRTLHFYLRHIDWNAE